MFAEEWVEVQEFPDYLISNYGVVKQAESGRVMTASPVAYNIPTVGFRHKGVTHRRSVPLLVCKAFVPQPAPQFDTPIHLDGDRVNCRFDNLVWRPRWFAVHYHKQFSKPWFPDWRSDIRLVETGEVFSSPREAAVKYGEMELRIYQSIVNGSVVFPHHHHYVYDSLEIDL